MRLLLLLLAIVARAELIPVYTVGDGKGLAEAVKEAQATGGRVYLPAGTHEGGVALSGNVSITGAPGAVWNNCNGTVLTVATGAHAVVSGIAFECGKLGVLFEKGASGRVEKCSFSTDVGVQMSGKVVDARRNFWGAPDGPRVRTSPSTGGRRAGAGMQLLAGPRTQVAWVPFSSNTFHSQQTRVFAVWPGDGEEVHLHKGAVVGVVGGGTLEYTITPDAGCSPSSGRKTLTGDATKWVSVPMSTSCLGDRVVRHASYRLEDEPEATCMYYTNTTKLTKQQTVSMVMDSITAPLQVPSLSHFKPLSHG
jgi:hypothetical protein